MDRLSFAKKVVSVIVILLIIFFFGKQIYYSFDGLKAFNWDINYVYLLIAFLIFGLHLLSNVIQYYFTLRHMGLKVSMKDVAKARTVSDLASYVPGKMLLFIMRMKYLKHEMTRLQVAASTTFELLLTISSVSVLFIINLLFGGREFGAYGYLFYLVIPLCFIIVHPKVTSFFVNIVMRFLKKEPVKIGLKYGSVMMLMPFYMISWFLIGLSAFFVVTSVYPISFSLIPQVMVYYGIAWGVGLMAVVVPSGIGVREGILAYMLSFYIPTSFAVIAAFLSRIVLMAAQLVAAWVSLKLKA